VLTFAHIEPEVEAALACRLPAAPMCVAIAELWRRLET
jgi:hypothetical protein